MAVGVGADPGEPRLWSGKGDSLRVSGDGIRRDRTGLSTGVILGAPRMCPAPSKTCLSYFLLLGIPQVKFLSSGLSL